tara:strand:- start:656 stop:862 length:207 start_codon:yes stop_codon:yes gene_type:complete
MLENYCNNIFVIHKGKEISIAQHFKDNKSMAMQEVGIIHENGDIDIEPYANTLDSLIETLTQIREQYK